MLKPFGADVWVATHKLSFWGTPVVTRMTVLKVEGGALFVHGPVPRTPEVASAVEALGRVRWVVAPNRFHHLYAGEWGKQPGAELQGAPGLARKRRDLSLEEIGPEARYGWSGAIDHVLLAGLPTLNEVIFLHRASRTLLVADLFFNYRPASSPFVRLVRMIEDCDGKFVVPRFARWLVRDRRALARSLERVMEWDFDRIVMAHGDVVDSGGRERVRAALQSLAL